MTALIRLSGIASLIVWGVELYNGNGAVSAAFGAWSCALLVRADFDDFKRKVEGK